MKDMGELRSFLGIEITRNRKERTITLSQMGYVDTILERFGFTEASPTYTPMVTQRLERLEGLRKGNDDAYNPWKALYSSLIGSLMYLMIATRPDLANAVGIVSRYLSNPSEEHVKAAKHILRYVKGTKDYALTLGPDAKESFNLFGYVDADWGNDVNTRKSTTGYAFYARRGIISWCSKRQSMIALSLIEAEYIALYASI